MFTMRSLLDAKTIVFNICSLDNGHLGRVEFSFVMSQVDLCREKINVFLFVNTLLSVMLLYSIS